MNEHLRILSVIEKEQGSPLDEDTVIKSMKTYNETIHSSTGKKPIDFLNGTILPEEYTFIQDKLQKHKEKKIELRNRKRKKGKTTNFLKLNRTNKMQPYHKKVHTTEFGDEHYNINKENLPRYVSQFKRKFKFQD